MFGRKLHALYAQVDVVRTELANLRDELSQRSAQVDAMRNSFLILEERLSNVDGRITHMSEALSNQLHELDNEIERLSNMADSASAETVSQLRANQVRIANEQARYAIALRQDLAELAELLRRNRG